MLTNELYCIQSDMTVRESKQENELSVKYEVDLGFLRGSFRFGGTNEKMN